MGGHGQHMQLQQPEAPAPATHAGTRPARLHAARPGRRSMPLWPATAAAEAGGAHDHASWRSQAGPRHRSHLPRFSMRSWKSEMSSSGAPASLPASSVSSARQAGGSPGDSEVGRMQTRQAQRETRAAELMHRRHGGTLSRRSQQPSARRCRGNGRHRTRNYAPLDQRHMHRGGDDAAPAAALRLQHVQTIHCRLAGRGGAQRAQQEVIQHSAPMEQAPYAGAVASCAAREACLATQARACRWWAT